MRREQVAPNGGCTPLIDATLVHVQFETIHPFLDGNGRIGRLLIALMLQHRNMLREPLLYLSLYFKQHRAEYYRRLDAVRTAQQLNTLFERDAERMRAQRAAASVLQMLQCFRRRPLATIAELESMSKKTFPTISDAVKKLLDAGIVRETTSRQRNRVYAYVEYMSILNEGGDPLRQ